MRSSSRAAILDAAVRVAERRGISGITLEAVAEESSLTKGGLMYHFATKDALLVGIQEHLAAAWELELETAAGKPASAATPRERLVAYVRVAAKSATRAELTMQAESANVPTLYAPWAGVLGRWRPPFDADSDDPRLRAAQIAVLAADGLWSVEPLGVVRLTAKERARLVAHILSILDGPF